MHLADINIAYFGTCNIIQEHNAFTTTVGYHI